MSKLKIAIFHLAFIYSGGGEKLALQEYDGLKAWGHDVSIFTTVIDKKNCFPDIIGKYNLKTFLPNFKILRGHEAFQTVLSCILAPLFAYKFRNYDVILACNQPSPWIAFIIAKMFGVPYVSYLSQPTRFLHQRRIDRQTGLFFTKKASESIAARLMMTTFKGFSNWADRMSVKNSTKILTNGEYIKRVIERIYKVKAISCPSGVEPIQISTKRKNKYILVTNRHFAQKRIEYAIFVLNRLQQIEPKYRLIITGTNTEYTQTLVDLVNELGMETSVDFLGYVDNRKLTRLYKEASVYLYTAPEEDFGMGIIEAMSFGTPVVAWNSAGPSKIITDGHDGFLAKPLDLQDFSAKAIALIKSQKLSVKIAKNALETVQTRFSYKNHMNILEEALVSGY